MSEKVTVLTPRKRRAIEALLEGKTIKEAAERTKISRKTLYVWLGQPIFRGELDRIGGLMLEAVAHRMLALSSEAVETLSGVLHTANVPVGNQVQVANAIIKRASELWELYNLGKRVELIEKLLDE